MINKFKSNKFKLRSGTQQGNPLSGDIFTIQINPLLIFLNKYPLIRIYTSLSRKEFLTAAFMDDANFITNSISSVINVLFYTQKLKKPPVWQLILPKQKDYFVIN